MSDLLLSSGFIDADVLAEELKFTENTSVYGLDWPGLTGLFSRVGNAELWQDGFDPVTGVSVALGGRLAFSPEDQARADLLPYRGGRVASLVIDRWLSDPESTATWLNGGFAVAIYDPRVNRLTIITDRLGVYPFYRFLHDAQILLGSHPDLLVDMAVHQGLSITLDRTTMAEALVTGAAQQPFTYYQEVQQLEPASVYEFDLTAGTHTQNIYWGQGPEPEVVPDDEMVSRVVDAVKAAVQRRTSGWGGKAGLLLSGGADSRALLFSAHTPSAIETITFYDQPNSELEVAKALAAAAQAPHHAMKREFDHYGKAAEKVVKITGGYWSVKDAHYAGFLPEIASMQFDTLMTGCYTDYLLKGLAYNVKSQRILGRPGPLNEVAEFSFNFYQPFSDISPFWRQQVQERLEARFPPSVSQRYNAGDTRVVEDLRVRPLSREADGMGRLYLWRAMPWDPVMVDSDIADCYLSMTTSQKMNAKIFRRAVAAIVGESGRHIRNNNDHALFDAPESTRVLLHFSQKIKNKLSCLLGSEKPEGIGTDGSWPDFALYVRTSPLIAQLWANPGPQQQEILMDLMGFDPWEKAMDYWGSAEQVSLFLRLLTLKIWLGIRGYK
ncbi:MAG: asparagine synthase-related protein [Pontibacterium sp.]